MKKIEKRLKKLIIFLLILLLISAVLIIVLRPLRTFFLEQKQIVYIAAVGPLSGSAQASGEAMRKGIQLYVDRVKRADLLEGKTLRLLPMLNDQDNSRFAMQRATDIALQHKALLVLGHLSNEPSLAAGEIYQKHGIPAITASATGDEITRTNPWYFRIIPNNSFQGEFLAYCVKNILQQDSTSIIFDQDAYGSSLARSYEYTASQLNLTINKQWEIDKEAGDLEYQVKEITTELRAMQDPGAIFFATHAREAVKIITSIKLPGTSYTLIGPDSFTTRLFIREFQQYSQEQAQPGYYSDGVYAASLFIADLTDNKAQEFKAEFETKYKEAPTWEAACYYDAVAVAVEAIKRAEIDGNNLRDDRRKVREALASLSDPDLAVPGITGKIYFNQSHEIRRPLAIGQYYKQQLLPAYAQYQTLQDEGVEIIQVDDLAMTKTQIVKAGVDLNNIGNFDLRNSTYTVDFYLWFRFQEDFNDKAIIFPDAITPITLETPIFERTEAYFTVRAYHIKADFKGDFKFRYYPFDRFLLPIKFHHETQPITSLRYVPDVSGLPSTIRTEKAETLLNPITGWKVEKISHVVKTDAAALDPVGGELAEASAHSEFITCIQIARENVSFAIKNFVPIIIMVMVLYLTYYIPIHRLEVRVLLFISVLLANTLYEYMLRSNFPTDDFLAIEFAIFTIYGLTALAAIVSGGGYILYERHHKIYFLMTLAGRILHPVLVFLVGFGFVILSMMVSEFVVTP